MAICKECGRLSHLSCWGSDADCPDPWLCPCCIIALFPFNHIEEDNLFLCSTTGTSPIWALPQVGNCTVRLLLDDNYNDNRALLQCIDVDPDQNYFTNLSPDGSYSSPSSLKSQFSSPSLAFSVTHINCRSLLPKLGDIRDLWAQIPVSVLALYQLRHG